jgi:predicted dehydrogenase
MIRLGVSNAEEAVWREVAPRLRGATIARARDAGFFAPAEACDAAAFLGSDLPEPGSVERLLRTGKHVLLAPACPSRDFVETWFETARRTNVQLAVLNPDRYLPSRQCIRQHLDAGKLGEPVLVRLHRWEPAASDGPWEGPRRSGPLLRALELTLWLMGKPPDRVYAIQQRVKEPGFPGSRFVQVHLGFPCGGMALIDCTNRLPPGDTYQSLAVLGSAGAAYADDHQNMQLVYRGGRPQAVRTDEGTSYLAAMVQAFLDRLGAGGDAPGDVKSWRTVWDLADAVERSLEAKQAIPLEGS